MKKLLLVFVVVVLCFAVLSLCVFAQAEQDTSYMQSNTYKMMQEFLQACPNRDTPSGELATAAYIETQFNARGLATYTQSITVYTQTSEYASENVYAVKRGTNPNSGCIVIGAHFDAVSEGANDNASGVVALLGLADKLIPQTNLPFDVIFVAFGGEEQGLYGSGEFVNGFATLKGIERDLEDIRVMFNMDSIANGDNLYVHVENKSTELEKLITSCKQGNSELKVKPYAVGTYGYSILDFGYGYYEAVQASDHSSFRTEGVPVVDFFSGNFKNWNFIESTDSSKLTMNSELDTLENLNNYNGAEWVSKIDTVVQTVSATITNSAFDVVSANARSEIVNLNFWHNALWPKIAVGVILIVVIILALNYYRKLQKQAILGTAEIKNARVFETPDSDDIFTFK